MKPALNRVRNSLAVLMLALPVTLCAHPLDGKIWDSAKQQFISVDAAYQRAATSRYVLLGEKHDSEIHHARQLAVLQALAQHGVKPALAMEQFDSPQQDALSAAQSKTQDAEALADAGQLNRKGWRWPMYKDLITFAAAQHWPLLAANLGRTEGRDIAMGKITPSIPSADAAQLALMEEDVVQGHCGQRPDAARLAAIVLAQRARDVRMAQALNSTTGPVVLIAGSGHVRRDRAVPRYLAQPERALSIGLVEIEDGKSRPSDYDIAGFDIAWFTTATERSDPCAQALTGSVVMPPIQSTDSIKKEKPQTIARPNSD
jgi:uncharacterized iron-regulated protein